MTQTKDNIIDRDQLQEEYILRVIDSMDYKDIERFVYDTIDKNLDDYTVDELIYEVSESYPDLLGDTDEDDLPEPDTPEITFNTPSGIFTSMFFKLLC